MEMPSWEFASGAPEQWKLTEGGLPSLVLITGEDFKTVVRNLLTCLLLNWRQLSQAPGASTIECPRGINVCK